MRMLRILPVLLLGVTGVCAQGFEGTVKWTMKMDISDPKLKAEMAEAQQQMNDPATQAQMKEMHAKMNDPEFKKMMEANPQMKAQMESMMKMPSGDPNSMMPKGMTVKVKGDNTLTLMEGGMVDGMEILHAKGKPSVRLDRQNKTYSPIPEGQGPAGGNSTVPKITKTGETAKVLGYSCTKYLAEVVERGTPTTQVFWTTTEIKDMDMKSLARQSMGQGGQSMFHEGIEGVPLKMEFASPQGNMVLEVAEIKRESLNAEDFAIPADFKEVKMPGRF